MTDLFENQSSLANMLKNKDLLKTAIISATIIALFFLALRFARSVFSYRVEKPVAVTPGGGTVNVLLEDDTGEVKSLADIESVEKTPGADKIRKYIDKNPEAVAQLLRNWLTAEAR
jgi:flagellar biosynthesis/type III secretory pathway M-ring protein FliF/YscJ